jgi:hypothetical protein
MQSTIVLDPLLSLPLLWGAAAVVAAFVALALWRGLTGWWLRGFALVALLAALANPSLQTENREALTDIVIAVSTKAQARAFRTVPSRRPRRSPPSSARWRAFPAPNSASCVSATGRRTAAR